MANPGQESPDNEAIRELRDELKSLGKKFVKASESQDRLAKVMLVVIFVQVAIALFQLVIMILNAEKFWPSFIAFFVLGGFLIYIVRQFDQLFKAN